MEERKFITSVVSEGKLNLRKSYEDSGNTRVIIRFSKAKYKRICELLPKLNDLAAKQSLPFAIEVEGEGIEPQKREVRFLYTGSPIEMIRIPE